MSRQILSNRITGRLGTKIRELRTKSSLQLRKAAAALDVDQSLLSKYERGNRLPGQDFLRKLAKYFSYDEKELLALWLCEKFFLEVDDSFVAGKALKIAEEEIRYSVLGNYAKPR